MNAVILIGLWIALSAIVFWLLIELRNLFTKKDSHVVSASAGDRRRRPVPAHRRHHLLGRVAHKQEGDK